MLTYTENEVNALIKRACEMQRFNDYQLVGRHLICNISELESNVISLLDQMVLEPVLIPSIKQLS